MAVRQVNMVPTLLFIKPLVFPKKCNEHLNGATLWKKNKMKIKLRFDSCQTNKQTNSVSPMQFWFTITLSTALQS